ncbi:MAG: sulfatase-like hydrolase/transferase, partial [Planctomycetota bacterium]
MPGSNKSNIILILADDLGWAELGCYGNTFNETPNLDKLAGQGMRFTDAYAPAPVCSPTRASLLTGQHPARVGIIDYLRPDADNA